MTISTDLMLRLLQAKKVVTTSQIGTLDESGERDLEIPSITPSFSPKPSRNQAMADVLANCLAPSSTKDNTPLK